MRIGLTCTTIEPALTHGKIDGIGIYTKILLDTFVKQHIDVTPFSYPGIKQWITSSGIPNGQIFPLPYTAATAVSLNPFMASLIYKNIPQKIDLLHVTDHMIPRIRKRPIIATIHDALMFSHPEWYPSACRGFKNSLRKETMRWCDHFITISQAMVPELVTYLGIPEKKIHVIYNGISPDWYETMKPEDKQVILKKLNIPQKFILFTGTLQPKKNIIRIIDAFLNLPKEIQNEYPLVIAGKIGWGATDILAAINQLTSQKAGYWLNYVSREELGALYQSATLYLCPSLHEGFGYTLLEAFASNTAVITSNLSALPEVAGDAAYLVDPYSTSEITSAMHFLLTHDTARHTLIQKGRQRASQFSLEKCANETLKLYQSIIGS